MSVEPHRLHYQEDGQEEDLPAGPSQLVWDAVMTILAVGLVCLMAGLVIVGMVQLLAPLKKLL